MEPQNIKTAADFLAAYEKFVDKNAQIFFESELADIEQQKQLTLKKDITILKEEFDKKIANLIEFADKKGVKYQYVPAQREIIFQDKRWEKMRQRYKNNFKRKIKKLTERIKKLFAVPLEKLTRLRSDLCWCFFLPKNNHVSTIQQILNEKCKNTNIQGVKEGSYFVGRFIDNFDSMTLESMKKLEIVETWRKRSRHEPITAQKSKIYISRTLSDIGDRRNSVIHELGHWLERHPNIESQIKTFFSEITKDIKTGKHRRPQKLGGFYGVNEKYIPANIPLPSKYCTKVYPDGSTELLSIFLQEIAVDIVGFTRHYPDYFNRMMEILR